MTERRDVHDFTMTTASRRLLEHFYERCVIGNVERGAYVECMIELALSEHDQNWRLTEPWTGWDLEYQETRARLQIKQSAALQRWNPRVREPHAGSEAQPKRMRNPRFSIKPNKGYYSEDGAWIATKEQRQADLYVFAWHPEENLDIVDQRCPDQWEFFVVADEYLPKQGSIALEPLKRLPAKRCDYKALAATVDTVQKSLGTLKAG